MSRMLRHVPTGDLYVFTDILARRSDMEMVPEKDVPVTVEAEFEVVTDEPTHEVIAEGVPEAKKEKATKPKKKDTLPPIEVVESKEKDSLDALLSED